jgi:large subunit ribosomal protein L25
MSPRAAGRVTRATFSPFSRSFVMAEVVLVAEVGRPLGSRAVRRLRREGKVPGVVYGHGTEPVPVAVVARDLRVALTGEAGANQLLSLQTGTGTYLTLAREMQRHPVAQTVTHVDFVIVRRDEVISADVPITLTGDAIEVHHGDGLVEQQLFALTINALPTAIPSAIEVDISGLTIGGSVRVSDLVLPEGVTTDVDPESAVVVGQPPRVVVEEEVAEGEAEEGVEETAAAAAEPTGEAADTTGEEG